MEREIHKVIPMKDVVERKQPIVAASPLSGEKGTGHPVP